MSEMERGDWRRSHPYHEDLGRGLDRRREQPGKKSDEPATENRLVENNPEAAFSALPRNILHGGMQSGVDDVRGAEDPAKYQSTDEIAEDQQSPHPEHLLQCRRIALVEKRNHRLESVLGEELA